MTGVYILRSPRCGSHYIGSTNDIERRLKEHNLGRVAYTARLRPLELRIFISCSDLAEARKFERRLKKYKRKDILERVIRDGKFPWNSKRDGLE